MTVLDKRLQNMKQAETVLDNVQSMLSDSDTGPELEDLYMDLVTIRVSLDNLLKQIFERLGDEADR